jgi:hypothetical protein
MSKHTIMEMNRQVSERERKYLCMTNDWYSVYISNSRISVIDNTIKWGKDLNRDFTKR